MLCTPEALLKDFVWDLNFQKNFVSSPLAEAEES